MTTQADIAPANPADEMAEIRERTLANPASKWAGSSVTFYDACRDRETLLALYDMARSQLQTLSDSFDEMHEECQRLARQCGEVDITDDTVFTLSPAQRLVVECRDVVEHVCATLESDSPRYEYPGTVGYVEGRLEALLHTLRRHLDQPASPSGAVNTSTDADTASAEKEHAV